jgi:Zn-dependent protease/predicted transcriptional regulator
MSQAARAEPARGLNIGAIGGIPIRIDPSWLIIFALVMWSMSAVYLPSQVANAGAPATWLAGLFATGLFFSSLLAHELAHAVVARRAGIPVAGITLFLFGGVSRIEQEPASPRVELRVALVGPLTSFALAAAFELAARALRGDTPTLAVAVLAYLGWINAALGTFNLVPGLPLDGGRVLRALVWWRTGSLRRGTRVASNLGKGFALGLMALGVLEILSGSLVGGLWLVFIGFFMRGMASAGYQELALRAALEGVGVDEVMVRAPIRVSPDLSLRELLDEHLLRDGVSGYPVCEGEAVLGAISLPQLTSVPRGELEKRRVRDVMTPVGPDVCAEPSDSLLSALRKLALGRHRLLLVLRDGRLAGIVTRGAIQRVLEVRRVLGSAEEPA